MLLLFYFRNQYKLRIREMLFQPVLNKIHRIILNRFVFYGRIHIIKYCIQYNTALLYSFKAKQRMIDASQFTGSNKDKRIIFLGNVVYCQKRCC